MLRKMNLSQFWPNFPEVWSSMDRFMGSMSSDLDSLFQTQSMYSEWKQTEKGYELRLEVPGFNKEELKMEVDQETNTLMIDGKKKDQNDRYASQSTLRISRSLPEGAKLDTLTASVQDGVCLMSVQVEKRETKARTIPVTIS